MLKPQRRVGVEFSWRHPANPPARRALRLRRAPRSSPAPKRIRLNYIWAPAALTIMTRATQIVIMSPRLGRPSFRLILPPLLLVLKVPSFLTPNNPLWDLSRTAGPTGATRE